MDPDTPAHETAHIAAELDSLDIRSQSDLHRMWELLMRPLGFSSSSLWVTPIDPRGRPLRALVEIGEIEELPDHGMVGDLVRMLRDVLATEADGTSVAFLVTRPGRGGVGDFDRRLAGRLITAARDVRLPCHPVHVANDRAVLVVAPDDLAA